MYVSFMWDTLSSLKGFMPKLGRPFGGGLFFLGRITRSSAARKRQKPSQLHSEIRTILCRCKGVANGDQTWKVTLRTHLKRCVAGRCFMHQTHGPFRAEHGLTISKSKIEHYTNKLGLSRAATYCQLGVNALVTVMPAKLLHLKPGIH